MKIQNVVLSVLPVEAVGLVLIVLGISQDISALLYAGIGVFILAAILLVVLLMRAQAKAARENSLNGYVPPAGQPQDPTA